MKTVSLMLLGSLLLGQISEASPYRLQYGGRVTQSNGQPITGPLDIIANFYAAASGGFPLASQSFPAVLINDGVFNLNITLTPTEFNTVFGSAEAWIEIVDSSSGKTYPRQRFSAVPYAFKVPVDAQTIGYNATGQLSVKGIAGSPLPVGTPADGQILKWRNGSGWEWGSDDTGAAGSVDSAAILDGSITNADIAASAAISGTKISPNFGAQNITTTGVISGNGSGLTNLPAGALGTSIESSEITDATITDTDISGTAAIAQSKVSGLTSSLAAKEPAFSAGTSAQYLRGDKSWDTLDTSAVPENVNLYYTDTRARAAISATGPVVYDSSSGVISMAAATSVASGYLSSADWLSFSNKQAAITAASTVNAGSLSSALQSGFELKPFGSSAGEAGEIRFTEVTGSGSNYIGFKAPDSIGVNKIWTLPSIDGSSGQVLTTNGSGVLSWTTGGGGGGAAAGTITDITAGTGLSGGTITTSGIIDLANTAVTAGSYTRANISVDAQGRLTSAANGGNVNLATETTGTLPLANGGTGSATAGGARTNLGLGSLSTLSEVSSSEITDATIADADISGSAAIAQSKISGLSTSLAGKEASITAGSSSQYFRGDKTWATLDTSAVPENTNLYYTNARARAAFSGTAPLAYDSSTGTFSMAAATSVGNGYLSSGDWLSFSNKQAAITAASTVNTGSLTSALQSGVQLKPYGSSAGQAGELQFTEVTGAGSNVVGFKAPDSIAADKIWTLPGADGTSGQVLSTNGSGVLAWASGSTGTVTSISAGTGLSGGTITGTGTINLANTSVSAGSYTRANVTVDAQGRLTSAANGGNVNLTSEVSGTLPVANGGTGAATLTSNGVLFGNGTGAVSATGAGSQYNVLTAGVGGTPSFGQLALGQSAAVSGQLAVGNGGTGLSSGTSGGIPYFSAASTMASSGALTASGVVLGGGAGAAPTSTAAGTAHQVLRIPGAGGAPVFGAIDVSQSAAVTGILPIANGGTGSNTSLNNNRIMVSSSGQIREASALSNGQVLIGSTGAAPVAASLTQGSNAGVTFSSGAGSLALDTVQDIRTSASPTFAGMNLSGSFTAATHVAGTSDNTANPVGGTLRAASASGSNITGSNLTITGGNGTGTGGSGAILFQTAPSGSSGSAANTLATRMTIDKTGNVGVSTTAPNSTLDVSGSIKASGNTSITGTAAQVQGAYLQWNRTVNDGETWLINQKGLGNTNAGIRFGSSTTSNVITEYARFLDSGNFGIGTTAPVQKLHVLHSSQNALSLPLLISNSSNINDNTSVGLAFDVGVPTSPKGAILFNRNSNTYGIGNMQFALSTAADNTNPVSSSDTKMTITHGGNVGIGTTAPAHQLTLSGNSSALGFDNAVTVSAKNSSGTYETFLHPRWTDNVTYLNYGSGGFNIRNNSAASTMFLQNGGNVGIGTASPGQKLSVSGGPLAQVDFMDGDKFLLLGRTNSPKISHGAGWTFESYAGSLTSDGGGGNTGDFSWSTVNAAGTGFTERMRLSNSGYLNLKTSNYPAMVIEGSHQDMTLYINNTSGTGHMWGIMAGGTGSAVPGGLRFWDNTLLTDRMVINSQGNVGIGTTSPSNTLHVVGSLCVKSAGGNCAAAVAGRIYASTTTVQSADLAENMPVEDETLKPGDVVTLETSPSTLKGIFAKSKQRKQANAVGVVSTAPGVVLGSDLAQSRAIALAGRVPVNVNLEGGKIAVGDYLLASSTPGQAMRAKSASDSGIIGVALSAYDGLPIPAQDYGDGIAHEEGHQVMLLVQNGAGSQSAVASLEQSLAQTQDELSAVKARAAQTEAEAAAMKAFLCSRHSDAPFCSR